MDFQICPCCGTEFEYDDATLSHAELRSAWIRNGAEWHSRVVHPPLGWNPSMQLILAGYSSELPRIIMTLRVKADANVEHVPLKTEFSGMQVGFVRS